MSVLAIGVVLIPDAKLIAAAITLNRALHNAPEAPIVLDASVCLPHVSLAMGCVPEDGIPSVATILEGIAAAHSLVELIPTGFHVRQSQTGHVVASVELERTNGLQALHETVMRALESYFFRSAAPEMFVAPELIPASTLRWVNEYRSAASFERFWPHVTLGMGTLPEDATRPAPGLASRLAICQLGPHCTCRRVLFDTLLRIG